MKHFLRIDKNYDIFPFFLTFYGDALSVWHLTQRPKINISDFTWDTLWFDFNVPPSIDIDQRNDVDVVDCDMAYANDADYHYKSTIFVSALRFYQLIDLWRSFITNSTC